MISAGFDFPPADSFPARRREKLIGGAGRALIVFGVLSVLIAFEVGGGGGAGRPEGAAEFGIVVEVDEDAEAPVAAERE